MSISIVIDGAARVPRGASRGEASAAAVFFKGKRVVDVAFRALGKRTNNEAEYEALIMALLTASARQLPPPIIYSDSAVVCNQVEGKWRCAVPDLQALLYSVLRIREHYQFKIVQVDRSYVHQADTLCNKFLDDLQTYRTKGILRE